jgi:hypothetical protein
VHLGLDPFGGSAADASRSERLNDNPDLRPKRLFGGVVCGTVDIRTLLTVPAVAEDNAVVEVFVVVPATDTC